MSEQPVIVPPFSAAARSRVPPSVHYGQRNWHHMLTVDWAWPSPQYQDWLRTTLQATLLPGTP